MEIERKTKLNGFHTDELQTQSKFCIFGGDTNPKKSSKLDYVRVLEMPGRFVGRTQNKNALGTLQSQDFDSKDSRFQPRKFMLVGKDPLPKYRIHPSDHLGVWVL